MAVDLGTTTVAAYLCDLSGGDIIASRASANPQRRFGADVITRINFANEDEANLAVLNELVVGEINNPHHRLFEDGRGGQVGRG